MRILCGCVRGVAVGDSGCRIGHKVNLDRHATGGQECAQVVDSRAGAVLRADRYAKGRKQYLMIGDSVSDLYFTPVNTSLQNSSNVATYHAPINCGPTSEGVSCIQEWIGTVRHWTD